MCCSKRATREDRLRRIFSVFDVDGDGVISREDLELMVRQLAGSSFTCAPRWPANSMPSASSQRFTFQSTVLMSWPPYGCRMLMHFMVHPCVPTVLWSALS